MPAETVAFDEGAGPVMIEITSGYASLGTYQVLRRKDGEYVQVARDRPSRIDDEVPDAIPCPVPPEDLDERWVIVRGNYRPAPGHEQVRVTYTITQDGEVLHTSLVQDEVGDAPYLRYSHRFQFEAQ